MSSQGGPSEASARPNGNGYGASVEIARLYEVRSQKGQIYYRGRMGGVRVALLKTSETGEDGAPVWRLLIQEAPAADPNAPSRARKREAVRDEALP